MEDIIMRGNYMLNNNFGNNREGLSKTISDFCKNDKGKDLIYHTIEHKKSKGIDVMSKMHEEKCGQTEKKIEKTAFSRWNKIFTK